MPNNFLWCWFKLRIIPPLLNFLKPTRGWFIVIPYPWSCGRVVFSNSRPNLAILFIRSLDNPDKLKSWISIGSWSGLNTTILLLLGSIVTTFPSGKSSAPDSPSISSMFLFALLFYLSSYRIFFSKIQLFLLLSKIFLIFAPTKIV